MFTFLAFVMFNFVNLQKKRFARFFTVGSFGVKVHEKNCCGFRDKENDKSVSVQTINCSATIFPTSSFTIDPVNQGEIFTLEEI